jgi:hypothetical protein
MPGGANLGTQEILNRVYDASENAIRVVAANEGIFFSPGELSTIAGAPTFPVTNGVPRVGFPDAATTTMGIVVGVPKWWDFMGVSFVWTGSTAGVNPVRWTIDVKKFNLFSDNISEAVFATATANVATIAAAGVLNYTIDQVANVNLTPFAFGNVYSINISRIGADGADTYTGVAELLNLVIRRNTGP